MYTDQLSATRINRLRDQGYTQETDRELNELAFGIRFAYRVCTVMVIVAMTTQSLALFSFMLGTAIFGIILPNHPFDYIYNATFSKWLNKPALPARSVQLRFACTIASLWLATVVYLLYTDYTSTAMILAGLLAVVAGMASTIDLCIPSVIYKAAFLRTPSGSEVG